MCNIRDNFENQVTLQSMQATYLALESLYQCWEPQSFAHLHMIPDLYALINVQILERTSWPSDLESLKRSVQLEAKKSAIVQTTTTQQQEPQHTTSEQQQTSDNIVDATTTLQ